MDFFFVPSILFLCIVAPLWLILHYRSKGKMKSGISEQDMHNIEEMIECIDKLTDRVETLEDILNESRPQWRKRTKDYRD
ncbi:MAG: envelope stress response membrane protein PspB [Alteromonadaceae bacterium]|nr:MAG: envelope stress response membrane protein PspB [Alteromonadaceae bacterium]